MIFNPTLPYKNGYVVKKDETSGEFVYLPQKTDRLRMERVTYTGTGLYGDKNPNVLIFPFKPILIFTRSDSNYTSMAFYGSFTFGINSEGAMNLPNLVWDERVITWWSTAAEKQHNEIGRTYEIWALG